MPLPRFTFTDRAAPFIELGVGDTRIDVGVALWDVAHWDDPTDATWSGAEPSWLDVTCHGYTIELANGRQRNTDTFAPATATVVLDNTSGWADETLLVLRPGRSLRVGIDHTTVGRVVLFRGIVDAVAPRYSPTEGDSVELSAVCALGDVGRVELADVGDPGYGAGENANLRVNRILNAANWPASKRDLAETGVLCTATRFGQQTADMLTVVGESTGGAVYGDTSGRVVFRGRDWQMFYPTTPVDATIGNVGGGDVCPSEYQLAHRRDDLTTRVILGRAGIDTVPFTYNDTGGQTMYGIEVFQATDLVCSETAQLTTVATRLFRVRGGSTAKQRVERVLIDPATDDKAVDLATVISPFDPVSRVRCRLNLARGVVFDRELLVTGVRHSMTPDAWSCDVDLDDAAPFATVAARWDENLGWNLTTWAAVATLEEVV